MEAEKELVTEQLRFDLRLSNEMTEDKFAEVFNRLLARPGQLSGLPIVIEYNKKPEEFWKQKEEKLISFTCNFHAPNAAKPEDIQAFITAAYLFAAELEAQGYTLQTSRVDGMLPLVTEEGFTTPVTFSPARDDDISVNGKYRHIRLVDMAPQIGDAMPLVFKLHQQAGVVVNEYEKIEDQKGVNDKRIPHIRYCRDLASERINLGSKTEQQRLFYISPIFKPQLIRARNFIMTASVTSLLGAAGGVAAFLFLPPPISFGVMGVAGLLLAASLVTIAVNIYNYRKVNSQIKASVQGIEGSQRGTTSVSSALSNLGSDHPHPEADTEANYGDVLQPAPNETSEKQEKYIAMLLALERAKEEYPANLKLLPNKPEFAKGQLEGIFKAHINNIQELLADNSVELREQRDKLTLLVQWYNKQGIQLPTEADKKYEATLQLLENALQVYNANISANIAVSTDLTDLREIFEGKSVLLRELRSDTSEGLENHKQRAEAIIAGYKKHGIDLPPVQQLSI